MLYKLTSILKYFFLPFIFLGFFQSFGYAHETAKKLDHWDNSISAGGTINTGNTNTTNLGAKLSSDFVRGPWNYQLSIEGELDTANGQRTAQNATGIGSVRYLFEQRTYSFAKSNATFDAFATYDRTIRAAIGLGKVLIKNKKHFFSVEAGPGSTHQRISGSKEYQTLFMANGSMLYKYQVSPTAKISQAASIDYSSENTHSETISAIRTKVTDGLALEISFTLKHDSTIPANSKNTNRTDTATKVAVVYDF